MCKNYDSRRRSIVTTLIVLAICFVIVTGSTFSLFTSTTGTNIAVTAGKVEMTAVIDAATLTLYSKGEAQTGKFYNGGLATFNDKNTELTLTNITPGDSVSFNIVITNDSTVDLQYRVTWTKDNALAPILDATVDGASMNSGASAWTLWKADAEKTKTLTVTIELPLDADDTWETLSAEIGFSVEAVQANGVDEYEALLNPPKIPTVNEKIDAPATDASGATTEVADITDSQAGVSAVIPEGVKLAEGAEELTLSVKEIQDSQANVAVNEEEETKVALDVHIEGIADDNTIPMEIKLAGVAPKGLNIGNLKLYHVEDGVTIEMTQVAMADAFTAHNQFKYDAVTGDLILYMASFSEVAMVAENDGHWHGTVATSFNKGTGTEDDPYIISNADELAFFRDVVDGKAEWSGDRSFKGQYVALANDIILNHHGETSNQFDPIGWGYDNASYNRNGAEGKVFMGTFDGGDYKDGKLVGRHGIHGLWQNGWDLEAKTGTDYTYTNCGFGLFAAVKDATIKNLEIKHANVTVECVEAGLVVGLAQGNCTFQNLYVYSSHIANYQRPAGGVVGEVSPGFEDDVAQETRVLFDNVHVGSSCTVGSLWGDFDTPCGGVIGAYWDDAGKTKVHMKDVDVSCVLDVYSDVTSAYQWYAYRRAGMLIGNTDQPPADGKNAKVATAGFLTCENCVVIYDSWVNYYYCQFTNDNNPGRNYPWVRVQASQYNGAYSNPRYGHPADLHGHTVTSDNHEHQAGDTCHEYIPFNQLYGGGQGVYGGNAHIDNGVTIGTYTVVYMEGDEILDVHYVVDNSVPYTKLHDLGSTDYEWVDIDSKTVTEIPAGNAKHIVLYRNIKAKNMVRFVDKDGYVITEQEFTYGQKASNYQTSITPPAVPPVDGYYGTWPEWWNMLATATKGQDVTVHPVYTVVYEDPDVVPDENEVVIFDENGDVGDLFKLISQGKSVVMYKDLAGAIGNASTKTFATVVTNKEDLEDKKLRDGWVSAHARLDLDSKSLVYTNNSQASQNWTLFSIAEGASFTIGGGVTGGGTLSFVFNVLKGGTAPCLFNLEYDGEKQTDENGHEIHSTLILEKGVTVEVKIKKDQVNNKNPFTDDLDTLLLGHSHPESSEAEAHPGIEVEIVEEGDYFVARIIVNSHTTFVGNVSSN